MANMYKDKMNGINCSLCFSVPETTLHAVKCDKLPQKFHIKYDDLFSRKGSKFVPAIELFQKIWKIREKLLANATHDN